MAVDKATVKAEIVTAFISLGNVTDAALLDANADALAEAITNAIKSAEVTVTGGSSAGTYPVE